MPCGQIVAVVVLRRVTRGRTEVLMVSRCACGFIVLIAHRGPSPRLIATPGWAIAVAEVVQGAGAVDVVPDRENGSSGIVVEQQSGRFIVGTLTPGDVSRADQHSDSSSGANWHDERRGGGRRGRRRGRGTGDGVARAW